jgi:hypothetical protein
MNRNAISAIGTATRLTSSRALLSRFSHVEMMSEAASKPTRIQDVRIPSNNQRFKCSNDAALKAQCMPWAGPATANARAVSKRSPEHGAEWRNGRCDDADNHGNADDLATAASIVPNGTDGETRRAAPSPSPGPFPALEREKG